MRRYRVTAFATSRSALPLEAQKAVLTPASRVRASVAPVIVTALPDADGVAATVTVMVPLVTDQPNASGFHGQASQSCAAFTSGIVCVATKIPFVASDVVTVNPRAAKVCTAVCTTADGASGEASCVGSDTEVEIPFG